MLKNHFYKVWVLFTFFLLTGVNSNAQLLKKIKESAKRAAEETIQRKVEDKTQEKTEEAMDSLFNAPEKMKKTEKHSKQKGANENSDYNDGLSGELTGSIQNQQNIVTGSQFFPEGNLLFEEQFQQDMQGDFPVNWETNSGGEIILINGQKALRFYPDGVYLANTGVLPENYALEFDLTTSNLNYKGLASSRFGVIFSNEKTLSKKPASGAGFSFSLWYNGQSDYVLVKNWDKNTSSKIDNKISYDIRSKLNTTSHFTLLVNGKRLRVYVDSGKVLDLPSLLQNNVAQHVTFYLNGTSNEQSHIVAISNIKITEEGQDLRSQILKGGFSTTKILFASGSDKLKSESYSFLDKLAQTLNNDESLRVSIIGHTDSDGAEAANLTLSKKRAESVKRYLIDQGVQEDRLQTYGKGESDPLATNETEEGKAQNRRVEFKKL